MEESVVIEKQESLNTDVQGVTQLLSATRQGQPSIPILTSLCQWHEGLRCQKCDRSPNCAACESRNRALISHIIKKESVFDLFS